MAFRALGFCESAPEAESSESKPEMLSYSIIFSGEEERIMGTQQGLKVAFTSVHSGLYTSLRGAVLFMWVTRTTPGL